MSAPTTAARRSDTDLDEAYRQMRSRLRAFIAARVENPETAEDLTQEVLLRLVRSGSAVDDPTAWLYRVARNVIIDHYRGRRPPPADPTLPGADGVVRPVRRRSGRGPDRAVPVSAVAGRSARRAVPVRSPGGRSGRGHPDRGVRGCRGERVRDEVQGATRSPPAAGPAAGLLHHRGLRRRRSDGLCRSVVLHRAQRLRRLSAPRPHGTLNFGRLGSRCVATRLSSYCAGDPARRWCSRSVTQPLAVRAAPMRVADAAPVQSP